MISKENKTERLSQDIGHLNVLNQLRDDARSLRDNGIEALIHFSVKDENWEQQISDNEKVLFRRAKHLAWNLGRIPEHKCDHNDLLFFSARQGGPRRSSHPTEEHEYPDWPEISVPLFSLEDFLDAGGFCSKLKNPTDRLSRYVRKRLRRRTREFLEQYTSGTEPDLSLLKALVKELNVLIAGPLLYTRYRFAHVSLSRETQKLLVKPPKQHVKPRKPPLKSAKRSVKPLNGHVLPRLNRTLLCEAYPSMLAQCGDSIELFDMPGEPAPILFAANFLRTRLGNLRGYLDEGALMCYYRVIRELYNLHDTNWGFGAARPGEQTGKPSVFVTTECTRAIGFFARLMENTAQFLKRLHEIKTYVEHVELGQTSKDPVIPRLHEGWCASELEWCTASVKTTIESFRDYVALLLPNFEEDSNLEDIIACVESSVRYFARLSLSSVKDVMDWTKILRHMEADSFNKWRRNESRIARESKETRSVALQLMPESDLTETAHRVAWGALAGARQEFKKLRERENDRHSGAQNLRDKKSIEKELLDEASDVFAKTAEWLRAHLHPAREYFEKNLHRCLAENMRGRSPRIVQDLALSSLSAGLISKNWGRPDYSQAIEILCENLDENGEFPDGPPFCFTAKGEGRVVINAQLIRAFAQLSQHLTAHLNPEVIEQMPKVIERMIGYFRSHSIKHEHGIAWPSLGSFNGKRSCLWITSLSVLSLHRIVLMLDAYINEGVKKHFKRKSPAELKREGVPFLHELMCSDIGYGSLPEGQRPEPRRVVMELEAMRAHLLGPGRSRKVLLAKEALGTSPLRSLILYGPPGTGKTTLASSLALTSNVDLVQVRSHDLLRRGTELVIEQASDVMDALKLLTSTVILFDEFEVMLHSRPEAPVRITEMLTGNMLPKLDELYKAAGENGIGYLLATNYVEHFDPAAIRDSRFDQMMFIYYPDAASRTCRLVSEFKYLMSQLKKEKMPLKVVEGADLRLMEVVSKTSECYINRLCRMGWFVAPREIITAPVDRRGTSADSVEKRVISYETDRKLSPVWKYIIENEKAGVPNLSGSAKKMDKQAAKSSDSSEEFDGKKTDILTKVRRWDKRLSHLVENKSEFRWEKAIDLLSSDPRPFAAAAKK